MKMRLLLYTTIFLAGCSTTPKSPDISLAPSDIPPVELTPAPLVNKEASLQKKAQTNSAQWKAYVGASGYLNRPPKFANKNDESFYKRCSPLEVTGVYQSGNTIFVYVKQNGKILSMTGINRKDFVLKKNQKIPLLDQHLVKSLPPQESARNTASLKNEKTCAGQTWKNMTIEEFQFVNGDPEYRRPVTFNNGQYDVWTYGDTKHSSLRHYYFLSDRLFSWTQ